LLQWLYWTWRVKAIFLFDSGWLILSIGKIIWFDDAALEMRKQGVTSASSKKYILQSISMTKKFLIRSNKTYGKDMKQLTIQHMLIQIINSNNISFLWTLNTTIQFVIWWNITWIISNNKEVTLRTQNSHYPKWYMQTAADCGREMRGDFFGRKVTIYPTIIWLSDRSRNFHTLCRIQYYAYKYTYIF
jgi:hypothetical protein